YYGIRRFGMHTVVDLIPMLLHASLTLFLAGLIAFLFPINYILTGLMSWILVLFVALYTTMTILPIISLNCPYHAPFSSLAWSIVQS
ncbi:hypothetical protein FB451DRAFT_952077, partial [Mycena latifolia]